MVDSRVSGRILARPEEGQAADREEEGETGGNGQKQVGSDGW